MVRAIRFLGALPLLFISGNAPPALVIADADAIANWPAPAYWTRPTAWAPRGARIDAVNPASPPLPFIALNPCRVADTRGNGFTGAYGPPSLAANATRDFVIAGQCGVPSTAAAVSFNFAALNVSAAGDLRVFSAGGGIPTVSTLNYNGDTPNIANAAVVPLGTGGAITFQADATSIDLIIDVNGYYDGSGALQLSLSRRAALDQFWTPQNGTVIGLTAVGAKNLVRSDGADLWVAGDSAVSRVRGSDGKLLETWTMPGGAFGVLIAMGRVLVTDESAPGQLFGIDPNQPAGAATTLSSNLGNYPAGIAFDGSRVWTANVGGSVSIITPKASPPWTVTTITTGFSIAEGILYDGTNIWVTDNGAGTLLRLDGVGSILQTVAVGAGPGHPTFDGMDIWVPNFYSNSISVVRASTGSVLATLTGNGLSGPIAASFDGQRVMVTDYGGNNVSLWRVAGLAPLGFFGFQGDSQVPNYFPYGVCSDGINFWIALHTVPGRLARF